MGEGGREGGMGRMGEGEGVSAIHETERLLVWRFDGALYVDVISHSALPPSLPPSLPQVQCKGICRPEICSGVSFHS